MDDHIGVSPYAACNGFDLSVTTCNVADVIHAAHFAKKEHVLECNMAISDATLTHDVVDALGAAHELRHLALPTREALLQLSQRRVVLDRHDLPTLPRASERLRPSDHPRVHRAQGLRIGGRVEVVGTAESMARRAERGVSSLGFGGGRWSGFRVWGLGFGMADLRAELLDLLAEEVHVGPRRKPDDLEVALHATPVRGRPKRVGIDWRREEEGGAEEGGE